MKKLQLLSLIVLLLACSKKEPIIVGSGDGNMLTVEFEQDTYTVEEETLDNAITLTFSSNTSVNSSIVIRTNEISGNYDENYSTSPVTIGNSIELLVNAGSNKAEILVDALADSDLKTEKIEFEIISVQGGSLQLGDLKKTTLNISDDTPVDEQYRDCLISVEDDQLEIATWNIRQFPQAGSTVPVLINLINNANLDIIAVQEISNISEFLDLGNQINGWNSIVKNVTGGIDIGYLYKTSSITSFGTMTKVFTNDSFAFPREGVEVDITHSNGLAIKLINIHLKCCGEGEDRRLDASNKMKSYLDSNHPNIPVILLGDFNDNLGSNSPFNNFITDTDNYFFADQSIAEGPSTNWSFPGFPSHIDHILCTDELENNFVYATTLTLDDCVSNYRNVVSDHLPVVAVFR